MEDEKSQSRKEQADEILRNTTAYKNCEICGSILIKEVPICPNCQGYRFDEDPEHVAEQAVILGSSQQRSISPDDLAS